MKFPCCDSYRYRCLTYLVCGVFLCFCLLIARYYKIQICDGARWEAEALSQHMLEVKDPFRRGTFFSNTTVRPGDVEQHLPFVIDITKFHLCLDAVVVPPPHRDLIAQKIVSLVGGREFSSVRKEFEKKSRYCKLFMWLDTEVRDRLLAWWRPYAIRNKIPTNALFFVRDYQRSYPYGKLLGPVLHALRDAKDEKTGRAFPTGGLEAYFNHVLEGEHGKRKLMRSPLNRMDLDQITKIPKDGDDVYLTINAYLQTIAEEELEKGVKEAKAKAGWLILMNAHTGEILALAQYPFFEPAHYKEYFNDKDKVESTKVLSLVDVFEPGSIMKPITIALALQANEELVKQGRPIIFDPYEAIDVTRTLFPGRKQRPLKDISRNRCLNMYMAIQKSSNVYVAQLADRIVQSVGSAWYEAKLHELGFGKKTGIEFPGESCGLVPSPNRIYPNGAPEWSVATPYSLAMGYNILATGMQMVKAYAVLANGGYDVRPTLVKQVGGMRKTIPLLHEHRKILSDHVVKEVLQAMRFTTCPGGTGVRAAPQWHTSAGKTGTSEKLINGRYDKKKHISSFIGITPVFSSFKGSAPLVMLVSIDEPEYGVREDGTKNHMGGRCAAPIFGRVADRVLSYLGIPGDKEQYSYDEKVAEMKSLYTAWNRS